MRLGSSRAASPAELANAFSTMRANGSSELLIGNNGEVNAGSVAELASRIVELSKRTPEAAHILSAETAATASERRDMLIAAYTQGGAKWAELGADIVADVQDRTTRMGFTRRILERGDLAQGSYPRVRMRRRNVEAVIATGPVQINTEIVRDLYLFPDEFYITANVFVEQRELSQGSPDVLGEKYLDCLESILVKEDATLLKLIRRTSGMDNEISYFSGALTPTVVGKLQEQVTRWTLPTSALLIAVDLVTDMNVGSGFNTFWDPVSKLEIILTGKLGNLFGMELITDGFRDPRLKVLNPGELVVVSSPPYVGAYTDRGPVQSEPSTGIQKENRPGKGWYCFEEMSQCVANPRGVAVAQRQ